MNLNIALEPTADIAIGINITDLKKASPLFNLSEMYPTTNPNKITKVTTPTSQII